MEISVPTLSGDGFVTDIRKKADMLVAYYLISEFSQTTYFLGQVASLKYQVKQFGHDLNLLRNEIENTLEQYLSQHFDSASVTVKIDTPIAQDSSRYDITFEATVVQKDKRYSLGQLIEAQNGRVIKIIKLTQFGEA